MDSELELQVYRQRLLCHTMNLSGTLLVGRQRPGEPNPIHCDAAAGRLIVSAADDSRVSREHLSLTVLPEQGPESDSTSARVQIINLSGKRSITINRQHRLGPEQRSEVLTPVLITFADMAVRVEATPDDGVEEVHSLEIPTRAPGQFSDNFGETILQATTGQTYSLEQFKRWLIEMMAVLQRAAGAEDYLAQSVDAVDRIVGLDHISALRLEHGQWRIAASKSSCGSQGDAETRTPSRTILRQVLEKRSTVFHVPVVLPDAGSLRDVKALVASPILDAAGSVTGALYGARFSSESVQVPQISELEATMVEVIACSAAAGIARELQQQKALQVRIQFEQFFTPQLARELEANPSLLDSQDADISVVFCDIVGFSAISHRIGSTLTMQWINDVMELLSAAVFDNEGVVVDYIGDEMMAMWGAPKAYADHAAKACFAAEQMFRSRKEIDAQWLGRTGQSIDFRIGICSGKASVGNAGSRRRLKYGPLGDTVNLASRLQSAAKQLDVRQLVGAATAAAAGPSSSQVYRPLGTARFVNISEPFEMGELGSSAAALNL